MELCGRTLKLNYCLRFRQILATGLVPLVELALRSKRLKEAAGCGHTHKALEPRKMREKARSRYTQEHEVDDEGLQRGNMGQQSGARLLA